MLSFNRYGLKANSLIFGEFYEHVKLEFAWASAKKNFYLWLLSPFSFESRGEYGGGGGGGNSLRLILPAVRGNPNKRSDLKQLQIRWGPAWMA
jgi:hypothetical protein